ncbi:MAG: hypothetical protein KBB95_10515 [Deltaproteobacteria bacterium]|nr:hypothetical protein [Deltaproteobacteria bacterium]
MSGARCALVSAEQDEPMLGTAPEASAFLLVEVRGSWASKILASELPEAVRSFLATLEASHPGLRLQFVRAPRRTRGAIAVYLCRVGDFVSCLPLERLEDVPSVDVGAWLRDGVVPGATREGRPLTLVCTHGRRDACCALQGNPLFDSLAAESGAHSASELPVIWQTSHLGGHRFAPVILSLPDGHCYGRMGVDEAEAFLRAQAEHRVHTPARLRGCAKDSAWVQAASVAYRTATDERAFGAVVGELRTVSVGSTRHVTLETLGGAVRVEVEQELHAEALRPASCGEAPTPTTLWRATLAR